MENEKEGKRKRKGDLGEAGFRDEGILVVFSRIRRVDMTGKPSPKRVEDLRRVDSAHTLLLLEPEDITLWALQRLVSVLSVKRQRKGRRR